MTLQAKLIAGMVLLALIGGTGWYVYWATGRIASQDLLLEQASAALKTWEGSYNAAQAEMTKRDGILAANRREADRIRVENDKLRGRLHDALQGNECAAAAAPAGYVDLLFPVLPGTGPDPAKGVQDGIRGPAGAGTAPAPPR